MLLIMDLVFCGYMYKVENKNSGSYLKGGHTIII